MKKFFGICSKVIGITSIAATTFIGIAFAIYGIQETEWPLIFGSVLCVIMLAILIKIFIIDEIKKHH